MAGKIIRTFSAERVVKSRGFVPNYHPTYAAVCRYGNGELTWIEKNHTGERREYILHAEPKLAKLAFDLHRGNTMIIHVARLLRGGRLAEWEGRYFEHVQELPAFRGIRPARRDPELPVE